MSEQDAATQPPVGPQDQGPLARPAGAGRWERFTYSGPPGSRRYFVYTPVDCTLDQPVPMTVMLHGCTQTPADAATGTGWNLLADRQRFVVVYPEQSSDDNPLSCWNWFLPAHQVRGAGEAGIIAGICRQVLADDTRWNIDPARVYLAGMSAGAAMATILGATYPDLFAALAAHSGLQYRAATDDVAAREAMRDGGPDPVGQGRAAFAAMRDHRRIVPTVVVHGAADRVVNPVNGDQLVQQWMETNRLASDDTYRPDLARPTTVEYYRVADGHAYTVSRWNDEQGRPVQEKWTVAEMNHAWSGGSVLGSFTDPRGPDAAQAMWSFFTRTNEGQRC